MAITKILVANRSEIAIRVFRAANELGLKTVAIWAEEDKYSLHRFKADESYQVGRGPHLAKDMGPIESYLSIEEVIRVARLSGADAIHPGYGLLSESPEFAEACAAAGITFIGPKPETMRRLGNKVAARNLAIEVGVPVVPATDPLPDDMEEVKKLAAQIGYPVMLKASWGGGGRGMRAIRAEADLAREVMEGKREAKAAFGKDEVYLEKLIERARHVEVQVLGDTHGNAVHLFERDCSIQRRNQKVVERAPAPYLSEELRQELCGYALKIARETSYIGAGTVEFLQDADTGKFYFIEVNPRIQVEHTVTEQVTGIDIVKAQIHILDGFAIGTKQSGVPAQKDIRLNGHALQCRITTEDPEHNFIPDYGRITAYREAAGFGIRLDGGTAYSGAVITRFYDPLLEKVTAWAPTPGEAISRMNRALREFRIRGVATNLTFLEAIINHPRFADNSYTTKFIDTTPELFEQVKRQDRATKLLTYLADVSVNGHPETRGRPVPKANAAAPVVPYLNGHVPDGSKQRLDVQGPEKFAAWMREQRQVLVTDTTMRDGHQSLLATRMRTYDIVGIAGTYARALPQLLSLECWGGATFDVAMRFLTEDPWERLSKVREAAPNLLLQMLLRGANGVGYTNYPDNVVQHFVKQAASGGVDLFRVFDCLNWVENMRVAMDAVGAEGKLVEAAICYTGDILDPARAKYDLKYYVGLAKELEAAGAHIIAVKDMAGLLKPAAARVLFKSLREATDLPIHFHTHDTSGLSAATVLAAVESGADAIDAAMDSFSGNTSQPCLGSIVEALKGTERDPGLNPQWIRHISFYWEAVRNQYAAFESDLKGPASEVYLHEMPGGQFTNLKEQARSLGLETRWHEVAQAYHDVNLMFGDIVKVTPSSKVVGDMALMMVSQDLTVADVENPAKDIAFPDSVVSMLRGDLGQSPGGWPAALQKKALKGDKPITVRPGSLLKPADLKASRKDIETKLERKLSEYEFASWLMYPKVFTDFAAAQETYGPVSVLPTPTYFYGMKSEDEIFLDIEKGKTLVVRCQAFGDVDDKGMVTVFFELNGQPRRIKVPDRAHGASAAKARRKAEPGNEGHVGAPMPGVVSALAVAAGQAVKAGDVLLSIEAMKMETALHAECDGEIAEVLVKAGDQIDAKDLLIAFK
ncbi:pyruvate carboxylase [Mesorhizobium sp. M2D.F.Ca.ET.185.01.1.1]|uniref:pyruvate carboxylase n=1 Tax=unclassified Mesorhizobium TaxID=325217 RepID=UPI000FCAE230|nr:MULTISPECIES: pyruvate carboxylase [unclassified Mesorhizobium]TGP53634.1 pyruvate carboxylase [bacterium M00.F.Ca.ET.230.01.1.1]TGP83515.1 pyruvate carboxylase [bacterium M00.F.Ca.ET.227.01.1.1]TGP99470.1 pyruvate carboxylase [bacterium M00.F.Ca.ET.221.01.1.1]TGQ00199.1 pyruvate carboxylase [bacterium M00.F.Ca.ET.222.01.1.1]TGU11586.1 pyruvate carboxylase [bacterium M00.F.Ca.ET.163.01.1.1]TGU35185.1 pyruvate carboxylase [bacterium M00.F.Ca.ET.156.01.1.1]TGU51531.1 pyruvate carboxylase [b